VFRRLIAGQSQAAGAASFPGVSGSFFPSQLTSLALAGCNNGYFFSSV